MLLNVEDSTDDELVFVMQNVEDQQLGQVLDMGVLLMNHYWNFLRMIRKSSWRCFRDHVSVRVMYC